MRESIAGAWLFSLVLTFMVILIGFISISINYNKAFKLKTTVVNLIEQNQGVNDRTIQLIQGYLDNNGYVNGKRCRDLFKNGQKYMGIDNGVSTGVYTKGSRDLDLGPQQVCLTRRQNKDTNVIRGETANVEYYYDVYMFFSFSLPVFGNIFKFTIGGTTNAILYPQDSYSW